MSALYEWTDMGLIKAYFASFVCLCVCMTVFLFVCYIQFCWEPNLLVFKANSAALSHSVCPGLNQQQLFRQKGQLEGLTLVLATHFRYEPQYIHIHHQHHVEMKNVKIRFKKKLLQVERSAIDELDMQGPVESISRWMVQHSFVKMHSFSFKPVDKNWASTDECWVVYV